MNKAAPRRDETPNRARRPGWLRTVLITAAIILLAATAVVAALPALLSTDWGRDTALGWVNDAIPGEIEAGDASLSWLGGQSVAGLVIRGADGRPVLQLASFATDLTLIGALRSQLSLGETVVQGLDVDLELAADGGSNLAAALGSAPAERGTDGGGIVVPVTGNMALLDSRVAIAAPGIEPVVLEDLSGAVRMTGREDPVELSLNGRSRQGDLAGSIQVTGRIDNLFPAGQLDPAAARADVRARIQDLPVDAVDQLLGGRGLLSAALGDRTTIELRAGGDAGRQDLALDVRAPGGELSLQGVITEGRFGLSEPAEARLQLTPALVETANRLAGGDRTPVLAEAVPLQLTIQELAAPLAGFSPAVVALRASLEARAPIRLTGVREVGDAAINDLRVAVDGPALGDRLTITVNGQPVTGGRTGNLALNAEIRNLVDETGRFQPARASVQAESRIAGIPTSLVDSALGQEGLLVEAAGPTLDLDLQADTDDAGRIDATVKLEAERLKTDAVQLTLGEEIALARPGRVELSLTPGLWQRLTGEVPAARLAGASSVTLTLQALRLPMPPAPFDYRGLTAAGSLELDPLVVDSGGRATTIKDTAATFRFEGGDGGRAELELDGRISAGADESGELTVDLDAGRLLNGEGQLDLAAASLELAGRLQQLPAALIDQLLGMDGLVTASLGATADLTVDTQLDKGHGPVSVALNAANGRADIKARIGDQGLTLTEPLTARFEPTPELGQKVLSRIHPIFETTQRAEQPIRLEVPAEGVLIPMEDFRFERITVPTMSVDFGKLVLKSGWLLRGLVGLGRQFGKLENVQREEWVAWLTPGVLEVRDGEILYRRRLDILLDQRLHLATWGSADVAGDRSNLILAFMPGTMERVFSITVAEDDALHIPVTGPLSSPSIDFKKTAADLARLRAREEVAGENPLAGLLLDGVAGRVTGGGGVPPPSVSPLPWTAMLREQDAAAREQEQAAQPSPTQQQQSGQQQQQAGEATPEKKKPSTEEQVIKGLIDLLGNKKKD